MSEAPERIWADAPDIFDDMGLYYTHFVDEKSTVYIRTDLSEAAIAAARAEAFQMAVAECQHIAERYENEAQHEKMRAAEHCSACIKTLSGYAS